MSGSARSAAYESCTFGMPCFDAKAVGAAAIPRRDRSDLGLADVAGGFDHGRRRDAGRAEDADPNGVHETDCKRHRHIGVLPRGAVRLGRKAARGSRVN